jgi:magnesium transporter
MVAGIYGMNFKHLPELEWRYGYFVVLGALSIVSFALFRVFRRNKWL